jgi:hypothetical protein
MLTKPAKMLAKFTNLSSKRGSDFKVLQYRYKKFKDFHYPAYLFNPTLIIRLKEFPNFAENFTSGAVNLHNK